MNNIFLKLLLVILLILLSINLINNKFNKNNLYLFVLLIIILNIHFYSTYNKETFQATTENDTEFIYELEQPGKVVFSCDLPDTMGTYKDEYDLLIDAITNKNTNTNKNNSVAIILKYQEIPTKKGFYMGYSLNQEEYDACIKKNDEITYDIDFDIHKDSLWTIYKINKVIPTTPTEPTTTTTKTPTTTTTTTPTTTTTLEPTTSTTLTQLAAVEPNTTTTKTLTQLAAVEPNTTTTTTPTQTTTTTTPTQTTTTTLEPTKTTREYILPKETKYELAEKQFNKFIQTPRQDNVSKYFDNPQLLKDLVYNVSSPMKNYMTDIIRPTPSLPPVCLRDRYSIDEPVAVLASGTPANVHRFSGVGTILPKFAYKEEYDERYY